MKTKKIQIKVKTNVNTGICPGSGSGSGSNPESYCEDNLFKPTFLIDGEDSGEPGDWVNI